MNGDEETGVTIIDVDPIHFDCGDILNQKRFPIKITDTYSSLSQRLGQHGGEMLLQVLKNINMGTSVKIHQATLGMASRAPKIKRSCGHIELSTVCRDRVYNLWRGIGGNPGVKVMFRTKQVKIVEAFLPDANVETYLTSLDQGPGFVVVDTINGHMYISCSDRQFLGCSRLHVEYKKECSANEFTNGYLTLAKKSAVTVPDNAYKFVPAHERFR